MFNFSRITSILCFDDLLWLGSGEGVVSIYSIIKTEKAQVETVSNDNVKLKSNLKKSRESGILNKFTSLSLKQKSTIDEFNEASLKKYKSDLYVDELNSEVKSLISRKNGAKKYYKYNRECIKVENSKNKSKL